MRVEFSIALDGGYGVWSAFANRYWPAVYLAEAVGRIRYHHFGEGEYDEGEWMIQHLLREAAGEGIDNELVSVAPDGFEAQADWTNLRSPETYLGYAQGRTSTLPRASRTTSPRSYVVPVSLQLNTWAMAGNWTIEGRASVLNEAGGRIAFRFHARDIHPVLCSRAGTAVPFRVAGSTAKPPAQPMGWTSTRGSWNEDRHADRVVGDPPALRGRAGGAPLHRGANPSRDTDADQAFQRLHDGVARHFDAEEILEIMESS
jgi:Thioredoxin like C-terminal domain